MLSWGMSTFFGGPCNSWVFHIRVMGLAVYPQIEEPKAPLMGLPVAFWCHQTWRTGKSLGWNWGFQWENQRTNWASVQQAMLVYWFHHYRIMQHWIHTSATLNTDLQYDRGDRSPSPSLVVDSTSSLYTTLTASLYAEKTWIEMMLMAGLRQQWRRSWPAENSAGNGVSYIIIHTHGIQWGIISSFPRAHRSILDQKAGLFMGKSSELMISCSSPSSCGVDLINPKMGWWKLVCLLLGLPFYHMTHIQSAIPMDSIDSRGCVGSNWDWFKILIEPIRKINNG